MRKNDAKLSYTFSSLPRGVTWASPCAGHYCHAHNSLMEMETWALLLVFLGAFLTFCVFLRRRGSKFTVAVFHPYADAGGGGERVLWHALSAMLDKWPNAQYTVFTGDKDRTPKQIIDKVKSRFGINIKEENVEFVFLSLRFLIEPSTWPRFTLAGQMLGSIMLGCEALWYCRPHVLFDTMGYAFTYPLFRWLLGCKILSYVHYPIVSTDMLTMVASGQASYNNGARIGRSKLLTHLKIFYYKILALLYGFVGRRSDVVMVNSSWTHGHIKEIWKSECMRIVYPPCDCEAFLDVPSNRSSEECRLVSVGQFRPEKDHKKQIDIIKAVLDRLSGYNRLVQPKLTMIGSCRDEEDHARVESLKKYSEELGVSNSIEFLVNVPFNRLQEELSQSLVSVHTMWNEHFGISLVECMASGCIMVAHRSGGPLMDIVTEFSGCRTGFLAETPDEFADCIIEILNMTKEEREEIISSAKSSISERFSVQTFKRNLIIQVEPVIKLS